MTPDATTAQQIVPGMRGDVLVPDHELRRVIGRGSYGEVWEAHNVMGTRRAVKIVRRKDFDSSRPFEREFEGIKRYEPVSRSHAGLVQVLHVGMASDGSYFYYVMELADPMDPDGQYHPKTLRAGLQRRDRLPVDECIEIGLTLAAALGHLHTNGLVHRDVKPSNIIYVNGAPKFADVGLVSPLGDSRSMVGTEGYFAPEGTGQPRSDVFSLGKVLYECVTGLDRLKFPDVPESWGSEPESRAAFEFMEIVLRAAESNPDRRYASTAEMLSDLALLKAGKSLRHLRRVETRLRRAGQILAVAALALALAGSAWAYERYRRGQVEAAKNETAQAQQETQRLLGESLVAEARAVRLSGLAGARTKALDAVARGLKAHASLFDLRTQAASALAITDSGELNEAAGISAPRGRATWSADGGFAATASMNGAVTVFNRETSQKVIEFPTRPGVIDFVLSPQARWLAIVHQDRQLTVWNAATGKLSWQDALTDHPAAPAFSHDGAWLVYSSAAGLASRASAGGEPVILSPGAPKMRAVLLAPDGTWIAALPIPVEEKGKPDKDLGFRIYSGLTGSMPTPESAAAVKEQEIESDIRLEGPSISADSRYLAAAVGEDRLRVWEFPSLSQMAWVRGHQRSVRGTAFHPHNSGIVASTSWDGTTRFWDIPTRKEILILPTGGDELLLLPQRGEVLLRTWDRNAIRSAPLSTESALRVLLLPPNTPFGLLSGMSFNRDGTLLAAAGDAGVIVWEMKSGRPFVAQLPGEPQDWRDVVFMPDNSAILCSGRKGLMRRSLSTDAGRGLAFGAAETVLSGYCGDLQWLDARLAISGRRGKDGGNCVELLHSDGTASELPAKQAPDLLAAPPSGRWLAATVYPNGGGYLWDMKASPPSAVEASSTTRCAFGFSPDGSVLLTGTDSLVTITTTAAPQRQIAPPLPRKNSEFIPARSASIAAAGLVAIATGPYEITLCDAKTLLPLLALDSPLMPFDCLLEFSPDGRILAAAGGVSRVILWDIAYIKSELAALGLGW